MDILKNLNKRLSIEEGGICCGGEEKIDIILDKSPVQLPEDYIVFLKTISGDENCGISFLVDGDWAEIYIWSAGVALMKREEFEIFPDDDFMQSTWSLGDDLGGLVYFYGEGKDGFGIYRTSAGTMCFEDAKKIASSLTEFLVDGVGIDVAITL